MPPTEAEKFLEEQNVMEQPINQEGEAPAPAPEPEKEEAENRRERRLLQRLQAEKEANIAMAARLEALSEAQKFRSESEPAEYEKVVERIYGTDKPEAAEATRLLQDALKSVEARATERALEQIRDEQRREAAQLKEEEANLESFIDEIEDANGVTLTPEMRTGYFSLMERMSPKDKSGDITAYADPHAVWEVYQERLQKGRNPAKDLAVRGMQRSGASQPSRLESDATEKYLKDIGIL